MKRYPILYLFTLLSILFAACKKSDGIITDSINVPPVNITATVSGRIVNEYNEPVSGAIVTAGSSTTNTDINGQFRISGASLLDKRAFVKVSKAGYFEGSRTFFAREGQSHYVEIKLLPRTRIGFINGSSGGTINVGNGSAITLPANAVVVQSTGAAYTGSVDVSMNWIDPSSPDLNRIMPGDLRGIDESGSERGLISFGMLGVELYGTGGTKLQIAPGKKATLKFPLPTSLQATAPVTIALWSFNDTTGLWKQEGTATKSGNAYIAQVGHFSFWNCDHPFSVVQFSATFKNGNGEPLKSKLVRITRVSPLGGGALSSYGHTDSTGFVQGLIPANESLSLQVSNDYNCGSFFSQSIGPFAPNTAAHLGVITAVFNTSNAITLAGSAVNCNNAPVTNGFIQAETSGKTYRAVITNGSFNLQIPACNSAQMVTYFVADNAANQQSGVVSAMLQIGVANVGSISACGVTANQFVDFTFDGLSHSLNYPGDSVFGISHTQVGTTFVNAGGIQGGNTKILFSFNGKNPGDLPLTGIMIQTPTFNDSLYILPSQPPAISVTEFGTIGNFLSGYFNGLVYTAGGVAHPLQFSFRVRRQ